MFQPVETDPDKASSRLVVSCCVVEGDESACTIYVSSTMRVVGSPARREYTGRLLVDGEIYKSIGGD